MVVVLALDEGGKTTGQGSGVVVGEYEVVTNCHVLGKAADVAVRQAADWSVRETYRMAASLLMRNDERDLCLLFVDELPAPPAAQAVRLGAAKALSVGEEVYAVGAPAGLELSLSRGIVSQLRGAFGKRSAPLVQTDAAISPGSSGGGLFNQVGELVGLTTFKWRGESLNFALPAEWIEELRAQGRSKLMEAKRRVECPKNPDYECVIDLALGTANSINDHHVLAAFLFRGIGSVQAEAGDGSAAGQSFAVAIKASSGIDDTMLRVSALRTIAIAQAEAGDIAGGLRTAHGIHDAEERVWALYEIVRVQAKAGDLQAARRTVDSALALEKGHDKYVMGRGYNLQEIAIIQAEAGDIAAALSTARNLYDVGFMHRRTETLRQLVTEHAKTTDDIALIIEAAQDIEYALGRATVLGDIAKKQAALGDGQASERTFATALKTAYEIGRPEDRVRALCEIATAQTEAGDEQAAKSILATALEAAHDIDDDWWRSNASKDIAVAQAKAGDIATALEIAQPIDESLYRAEALRDIATVQAKTGNGQAAKRTFSAAFRAARVIRAAIFRVESLCEIATAQMEAGHGAQADQTFASALNAAHAHAIDEPDYSAIVSNDIMEFITAQAKAGDIAAAVRNAHSVEGAGFGSRALVDIAAMQAEEGDFEHAMSIAMSIKIADDRIWSLTKIARRLAAVK